MTPSPHLPVRFKRPTLLIVGCGDIGMRVVALLRSRWHLIALTSEASRVPSLRDAGVVPIVGNLDHGATLGRLAGLADAVLHLAPPPGTGDADSRTRSLLAALSLKCRVRRIVYASTSGVHGARRRVDAELRLRWFGRAFGVQVTLLRIPGIYAADRAGGHPRERLARGMTVLRAQDDVFTNHIHADDLARICVAALHRGSTQRAINASDDTTLMMGDYFDLAAELCGLPAPRRITREEARASLPAMQLSFMGESRRLVNTRLKTELQVRLRYPNVREGLQA
jgi:nucleoside-diphosphate-sugar epimerase